MMFRIIDDSDGSSVLGGDVPEGNSYIMFYPVPLPGQLHPLKLGVGERTLCKYNLSGTHGVYAVLRVS